MFKKESEIKKEESEIEKNKKLIEVEITDNKNLIKNIESELSKEEIATAEKIADEIINENKGVEVKDNDCCLKVRGKLQDNYEICKELDHKMANLNKTFIIIFLAGTAFGMSDSKWLPYASIIYEFGKDILTKG